MFALLAVLLSTSPQATEIIFQLGKGGDLVATSHYSDYPEEAKKLPRIGPVFAAGIERLVKFAPDWVVSDPEATPVSLDKGLRAAGLRHFPMRIDSVAALFDRSEAFLREVYGESTSPALEKFQACLASYPKTPRPFRFLAFAWLSPPILFGKHTYLSDLIAKTGGENLLGDTKVPFPKISPEWILRQEVDTVFYLAEHGQTRELAENLSAKWWPGKTVRLRGLAPAQFARGSFTPLLHAQAIVPDIATPGCAP